MSLIKNVGNETRELDTAAHFTLAALGLSALALGAGLIGLSRLSDTPDNKTAPGLDKK